MCTDHGQPALVSVRQLTVDVTDVNDVSPRFDQAVYVADVLENNFVGAFVAQLNATDSDSGANGWIVYGFEDEGDGSGVFEVDPDTGIVSARAVLDRETTSRYRMRVRAVDCGRPTPLTGTAVLIVNVVDVDDERPQFLSAAYSFQVAENKPSGTEVGRLLAVDADSPWNGKFYFRLRPPTDDGHGGEAFQIDERSGAIVTLKSLDRELKASYVLVAEVLKVQDHDDDDDETVRRYSSLSAAAAARALNSTTTVTVQVLDLNDNSPIFVIPEPETPSEESGSRSGAVMMVSNVARRGRVVATLTAVDMDDGDNALVTYSFVAGNDRKLFHIDPHNGDIVADVDLNGDIDNQVQIQFRAVFSFISSSFNPATQSRPVESRSEGRETFLAAPYHNLIP